MAEQIYKGFWRALELGLLDGTPDVRHILVMGGYTADEDAVFVADATLDEFDGVGYARLDSATTGGYVDAADEWQLEPVDGTFGDPVAPGSDNILGMVTYLHVTNDADSYILGFTDQGGFGINASNNALTVGMPTDGLIFGRQIP